jgi:hypothetical protein
MAKELTREDKAFIYHGFSEVVDATDRALAIDFNDHYIFVEDEDENSLEEAYEDAYDTAYDYLEKFRDFDDDDVGEVHKEISVIAAIAFQDNVGVLLDDPNEEKGDSGGHDRA